MASSRSVVTGWKWLMRWDRLVADLGLGSTAVDADGEKERWRDYEAVTIAEAAAVERLGATSSRDGRQRCRGTTVRRQGRSSWVVVAAIGQMA
ncbi:hypothetical protein BHE74_00059534 [Ensete ventricosum]|nr:hypothetical protein BHE74_00059534 [Ensete ventricosum]